MLRANYLEKLKDKNFKKDLKGNFDEDKILLNTCRPLKESEIYKLSSNKLEKFVDNVLSDRKLNNLLFSSNSKSEIDFIQKTNRKVLKPKIKNNEKNEINPEEVFLRRAKNEAISQIMVETKNFKENKAQKAEFLQGKAYTFYNSIKNSQKNEIRKYQEYLISYKKQRFLQILENIKVKIRNKIIELPDITLNLNDVYSRLYHNRVFIKKKENQNTIRTIDNSEEVPTNRRKIINFNIKNVLKTAMGKEFTIKITDDIIAQCYKKHSGGPSIKIDSNEEVEKHNYSSETLNLKDNEGNSFLHQSVKENVIELVYYFLLKGVNPNIKNIDGNTALHIAMKANLEDIVALLLDFGAEIDIENYKGKNPVDYASQEMKKRFGLESKLLQKKFDNKK